MLTIPKRANIAVAAAVAVTGLFAAIPAAHADPLTNCTIVAGNGAQVDSLAVDLREEEVDMPGYINEYRTQHGVPPLQDIRMLDRPAAWASNDSAIRGFSPSNHVDTLGRDIATRFAQCGVTGYNKYAEINYERWGGDTRISARDAMTWWENSPPHNAILLDPTLTHMGTALAYNGEYGKPAPTNRVHWTITFTG